MSDLDPQAGASLESSGAFTLDLQRAAAKWAGRLFPAPAYWLLRFVQLAHRAEASEVQVHWGARSTEATWKRSPEPLSKAVRSGLAELVGALQADWVAELRPTDHAVSLVVRRPWSQALQRVDEIALMMARCGFSATPVLLDGRQVAPRVVLERAFVVAPGGYTGRCPTWLAEARNGSWPHGLLKPKPLLSTATQGEPKAFLALRGELNGDNLSHPVQDGVALEPVLSRMPSMGLAMYWNAAGLATDASGFRLVKNEGLALAQRGLIWQVRDLLASAAHHLSASSETSSDTHNRGSSAMGGALAAASLGLVALGPMALLPVGTVGWALGALWDSCKGTNGPVPGLRGAWIQRLDELVQMLRPGPS